VQSRQSGLHAGYKNSIGRFSPFREKRFSEYGEKKRAKVLIFGTPAGSVIGMVVFYLLNAKGYFMKHGSTQTRPRQLRNRRRPQRADTQAQARAAGHDDGRNRPPGADRHRRGHHERQRLYAALKTPGPTRQAVSHTHGNLPHSPRLPAAAFANGKRTAGSH
jgi:hypothetical protein